MDEVEVSTVIRLPPEEVYEFIVDFPRYARYSKHLTDVRQHGDGTPGTRYDLRFAWWKLSYTAHSEVTETEPPHRLDWKLVKDLNAHGYWAIEPAPEEAPADGEASRLSLRVDFDPETANSDTLGLPRFVSMGWVIDKAKPLIVEEAQRVVERIVADLEGERRDVELTIHRTPDSI
ncbi:type II toxin-antitoxin system RatA family toxin [Natronorarus salvus]|uniref:type II toxin-antitoxin system RatA family toxin n=1 Tax=Natronorarus salvus TaxID=3117733 RepID=UPI002F25EF2F